MKIAIAAAAAVLLAGCADLDTPEVAEEPNVPAEAEPEPQPDPEPDTGPALTVERLLTSLAGSSFVTDDGETVALDTLVGDAQVSRSVWIEATETGVFTDGTTDPTVVTWAAETCFHLIESLDWDGAVYIDDAAGTELASLRDGRCDIVQPDG